VEIQTQTIRHSRWINWHYFQLRRWKFQKKLALCLFLCKKWSFTSDKPKITPESNVCDILLQLRSSASTPSWPKDRKHRRGIVSWYCMTYHVLTQTNRKSNVCALLIQLNEWVCRPSWGKDRRNRRATVSWYYMTSGVIGGLFQGRQI